MSSAPQWEAVDSETSDLLSLVANEGHVSADYEWNHFTLSLLACAVEEDGLIRPNNLRPLLRDSVAPHRIGAFTNRALRQGVVAYTGDYEVSDDTEGRNGGKPMRVMRWVGT